MQNDQKGDSHSARIHSARRVLKPGAGMCWYPTIGEDAPACGADAGNAEIRGQDLTSDFEMAMAEIFKAGFREGHSPSSPKPDTHLKFKRAILC